MFQQNSRIILFLAFTQQREQPFEHHSWRSGKKDLLKKNEKLKKYNLFTKM